MTERRRASEPSAQLRDTLPTALPSASTAPVPGGSEEGLGGDGQVAHAAAGGVEGSVREGGRHWDEEPMAWLSASSGLRVRPLEDAQHASHPDLPRRASTANSANPAP